MKKISFICAALLFSIPIIGMLARIEFLDVRLNFLFQVGWWLSFPITLILIYFSRWPKKIWARFPVLLLGVLCSLFAMIPLASKLLVAREVLVSGINPDYTRLHEMKLNNYYYTCYRDYTGRNGYAVDIRKESRFLWMVHYQILASVYPADSAAFYRVGHGWVAKFIVADTVKTSPIVKLE